MALKDKKETMASKPVKDSKETKTEGPAGGKEPSFEEALQELEDITRNLESGTLSLDESIAAYEKGMMLRKLCVGMLERAEKKLEYIEQTVDGETVKKPIDLTEKLQQKALFDRD